MAMINNREPHWCGRFMQPKVRGNDGVMDEEGRQWGSSTSEDRKSEAGKMPTSKFTWKMLLFLASVPANWIWTKIKPAICYASIAWISALLSIIPAVEHMLGQVCSPFSLCILYSLGI